MHMHSSEISMAGRVFGRVRHSQFFMVQCTYVPITFTLLADSATVRPLLSPLSRVRFITASLAFLFRIKS